MSAERRAAPRGLRPQRALRPVARPAGRLLRGPRRARLAHRPQRHGQDDAVQRDPADAARQDVGLDPLRGHASSSGGPSYKIAGAGIGYVPQGRRLFESLTVDEHLQDARAAPGREPLDGAADLRALPAPRRAQGQRRHAALRRRAADARDRARAAHEPQAADHGRALRGPRPDDHRDAHRDVPRPGGRGPRDPLRRAEPRRWRRRWPTASSSWWPGRSPPRRRRRSWRTTPRRSGAGSGWSAADGHGRAAGHPRHEGRRVRVRARPPARGRGRRAARRHGRPRRAAGDARHRRARRSRARRAPSTRTSSATPTAAQAMDVMGRGAAAVLTRLHGEGRVDGVAAIGGSGNSSIAARAMRDLPVGVPKLIVSTVASGDTRPYVGAVDITMIYSVVDISGINQISARILTNAAGAIAGMATATRPGGDRRAAARRRDDVRRHHALRHARARAAGGAGLRGARLPRDRHRRAVLRGARDRRLPRRRARRDDHRAGRRARRRRPVGGARPPPRRRSRRRSRRSSRSGRSTWSTSARATPCPSASRTATSTSTTRRSRSCARRRRRWPSSGAGSPSKPQRHDRPDRPLRPAARRVRDRRRRPAVPRRRGRRGAVRGAARGRRHVEGRARRGRRRRQRPARSPPRWRTASTS